MNRNSATILQEAQRLDREGKWEKATKAYATFLKHQPGNAAAWGDFGGLLLVSGNLERAQEACRRALRIDPACPGAMINLGCVLVQTGRYDAAEEYFRLVLVKDPSRNDARMALAECLMKKGDLDSTRVVLNRALAQDPENLDAHKLLCRILIRERDLTAACHEVHRRFTAMGSPSCAEAQFEIANMSLLFGDLPKGWEQYESRLRLPMTRKPLGPPDPTLWGGQTFPGKTLLVEWEQDPGDIHMFLRYAPLVKAMGGRVVWLVEQALANLVASCQDIDEVRLIGDTLPAFDLHVPLLSLPWIFHTGLAAIPSESPLHSRPLPVGMLSPPQAHPNHPRWNGEPFPGKTLLVEWEQGLGDTLMFVRYAPLVKTLGGKVILSVQRSLADVVATCQGVDEVIPFGDPLPSFDFHVPLLSLPWLFKTGLESIPSEIPYLHVPDMVPNRMLLMEALEIPAGKVRIGLAWSGNPSHKRNSERSIPAKCLAPLAALPDVAWYSFHFGSADESPFPGITPLSPMLSSFSDSAFALAAMDLVITVDTALAHLAGGMGIPTLLLVHAFPDWRWLLGRKDSPWYPTLHLYRQPREGDWPAVLQQVLSDLANQD